MSTNHGRLYNGYQVQAVEVQRVTYHRRIQEAWRGGSEMNDSGNIQSVSLPSCGPVGHDLGTTTAEHTGYSGLGNCPDSLDIHLG